MKMIKSNQVSLPFVAMLLFSERQILPNNGKYLQRMQLHVAPPVSSTFTIAVSGLLEQTNKHLMTQQRSKDYKSNHFAVIEASPNPEGLWAHDREAIASSIDGLDASVLHNILAFFGPYHFLPVAAVCSAFHRTYRNMHSPITGTSIALSSKAMAQFTAIPPTAGRMAGAAGYGKLEVMQWFQQQGCPWDSTTCSSAALNGHLD